MTMGLSILVPTARLPCFRMVVAMRVSFSKTVASRPVVALMLSTNSNSERATPMLSAPTTLSPTWMGMPARSENLTTVPGSMPTLASPLSAVCTLNCLSTLSPLWSEWARATTLPWLSLTVMNVAEVSFMPLRMMGLSAAPSPAATASARAGLAANTVPSSRNLCSRSSMPFSTSFCIVWMLERASWLYPADTK